MRKSRRHITARPFFQGYRIRRRSANFSPQKGRRGTANPFGGLSLGNTPKARAILRCGHKKTACWR